jgi:hypothetical protein
MGKKDADQIPVVRIYSDKKDESWSIKLALSLLALVTLPCACWLFWPSPQAPNYQAPRQPWAGWPIVGWTCAGVFGLLLLALLIRVIAGLYLDVSEKRASVRAAHVQARQVPADANGLYPAMLTRDGDALVNPNAAPAGMVQGLNGTRPTLPDAATEQGRQAANRAAAIQLVVGLGRAGAAAAGRFVESLAGGQGQVTGPELPPLLDEDRAPREVQALLEAARQGWVAGEGQVLLMDGEEE